tara:strand:+ start:1222 stop:1893 length:672 start_codon:yes stop_codon:yes gene_type:complete
MLYVSSELSKITRDYARIENAATLSKSIQYYKMAYGVFPESGPSQDVATMLYEEQILFDVMRDPLKISSTVKIDDLINEINYTYAKIMGSFNKDTLNITYDRIKIGILDYFNLSYNDGQSFVDSTANTFENYSIISNNDSLIVTTNKSNYPNDCVIVYRADNSSNSYEISVCLESDFFMNKKKWDGGNDDLRYELGSDLRLDTQIIVQENGKITSSENSSIFK